MPDETIYENDKGETARNCTFEIIKAISAKGARVDSSGLLAIATHKNLISERSVDQLFN